MTDPAGDPDPPLWYRNPEDDREPGRGSKIAGGVFFGGFATAAAGAILFCGTFTELESSGTSAASRHHLRHVAIFAGAALVALVCLFWPPQNGQRRSFVMGFMIGVFVMSLVEGTCFFNP